MTTVYFWLALYLALGVAVFFSIKVNIAALLDLTTRMQRLFRQEGRDDLADQAEANINLGARNPGLTSVLTWPLVLLQLGAMLFTVWRLERRAHGRPGLPTRQELIEDMVDERYDQVDAVFDDKLTKEERELFTSFTNKLAPAFESHGQAKEFLRQAHAYKSRADHAGAAFQLSGGRDADGLPHVDSVLLSVLVSVERSLNVSSMDIGEVESFILVSATTRRGIAIGPVEATELKAAGAVAAPEALSGPVVESAEREYLGEYWLHGDPAEQHWHGTLAASGGLPKTDEEKAEVEKVVEFFSKLAKCLDLNACQRDVSDAHIDEELSLDATIGAAQERKGPTA